MKTYHIFGEDLEEGRSGVTGSNYNIGYKTYVAYREGCIVADGNDVCRIISSGHTPEFILDGLVRRLFQHHLDTVQARVTSTKKSKQGRVYVPLSDMQFSWEPPYSTRFWMMNDSLGLKYYIAKPFKLKTKIQRRFIEMMSEVGEHFAKKEMDALNKTAIQ